MAQYIDKSALVAKIERWIELFTNEKNQEGISQIDKLSLGGRIAELQEVKVLLDTLEVKEVDSNDAIIEKACEWLEPVLKNYAGYYVGEDVLGDFRNHMKKNKL